MSTQTNIYNIWQINQKARIKKAKRVHITRWWGV